MKKFSSYFKLVLVLAIFAASCKGPAGDTGPAGPQGPQGAQGAAGANGSAGVTGPAGKDGASGTGGASNITTTAWLTVKKTEWVLAPDSSVYFRILKDKNINQSVLDKGAVFAYFRGANAIDYILPLPYTASVFQISFVPSYNAKDGGEVEFDFQPFIDNLSPASFQNDLSFRYVIIKDLTVVGGRLKPINWKDYNEVKRELNLKD
jgi:hypothetical protein